MIFLQDRNVFFLRNFCKYPFCHCSNGRTVHIGADMPRRKYTIGQMVSTALRSLQDAYCATGGVSISSIVQFINNYFDISKSQQCRLHIFVRTAVQFGLKRRRIKESQLGAFMLAPKSISTLAHVVNKVVNDKRQQRQQQRQQRHTNTRLSVKNGPMAALIFADTLSRSMSDGVHLNMDERRMAHCIQTQLSVVIHFWAKELIPKLLHDTHYRNQFETGTSSGVLNLQQRGQWETELFDGTYDKSNPSDRVKYGACTSTPLSPSTFYVTQAPLDTVRLKYMGRPSSC